MRNLLPLRCLPCLCLRSIYISSLTKSSSLCRPRCARMGLWVIAPFAHLSTPTLSSYVHYSIHYLIIVHMGSYFLSLSLRLFQRSLSSTPQGHGSCRLYRGELHRRGDPPSSARHRDPSRSREVCGALVTLLNCLSSHLWHMNTKALNWSIASLITFIAFFKYFVLFNQRPFFI